MPETRNNRIRRVALHLSRILVFVAIVLLIHRQHHEFLAAKAVAGVPDVSLAHAQEFFPAAVAITGPDQAGLQMVSDDSGATLGYVAQTSPRSDHIVGYSGPNNILLAFGADDRIVGAKLLSSGDTRDHAARVADDEFFLKSFNGLTAEEAARMGGVDAVSGATLTSLAVAEGVIHRLGGATRPGRFPAEVEVGKITNLFPNAVSLAPSESDSRLLEAMDEAGATVGRIARTTPHADKVMGYQGPTDALMALDADGAMIKGLALNESYDNQPYVRYVAEDEYFLTYFNGWTLNQLAGTNLVDAQVEGVSGATMTSIAMAEGMQAAARILIEPAPAPAGVAKAWKPRGRDVGTAAMVALGLAFGFTRLRAARKARLAFQIALIVYLGFVNGDMVSQALLVGWAQNGVAWRFAPGLVLLTAAALLVPIATRQNVYCGQLCPFGAAQELAKNRLPWKWRLPKRARVALKLVPAALLAWTVGAATLHLPVSLADIEPFDAFVWEVAGGAALGIAAVGLGASLFVPMAYCRYGCPTGALLNHLRLNARGDEFSARDAFALTLVCVAACL